MSIEPRRSPSGHVRRDAVGRSVTFAVAQKIEWLNALGLSVAPGLAALFVRGSLLGSVRDIFIIGGERSSAHGEIGAGVGYAHTRLGL